MTASAKVAYFTGRLREMAAGGSNRPARERAQFAQTVARKWQRWQWRSYSDDQLLAKLEEMLLSMIPKAYSQMRSADYNRYFKGSVWLECADNWVRKLQLWRLLEEPIRSHVDRGVELLDRVRPWWFMDVRLWKLKQGIGVDQQLFYHRCDRRGCNRIERPCYFRLGVRKSGMGYAYIWMTEHGFESAILLSDDPDRHDILIANTLLARYWWEAASERQRKYRAELRARQELR